MSIKEKIKEFFASHIVGRIIIALAVLLAVLVIFQAGVFVGWRRATFSYEWNDDYTRGPDDPRSIFAPFMRGDNRVNPHGAVGEIVSIALPTMLIKSPNSAEQMIAVGPNTVIRNFREIATTSDLVAGQEVIVIGEPDQNGRINASLIRILPPMNTQVSSSTPK